MVADTSKTGMKGRFIIFRHVNPFLQKECDFPILLGEVIGVNEDPDNPSSWKGRPDGTRDTATGAPLKEKWTFAVKRWGLKMTLNQNLSRLPDLRKQPWWTHNYLIDHERTTNHSHMFMNKDTVSKLFEKSSRKFKGLKKDMGHSVLYVDFANTCHGFVLINDNAEFTKTGIMSKHCLKCVIRKDETARSSLDKYAQERLSELEYKKPSSRQAPLNPSNSACSEGSYSPFSMLALTDAAEKSESDDSVEGGIFEEDEEQQGNDDGENQNKLAVSSFIDEVNCANDEDLDDLNEDEQENQGSDEESDDEPPDVGFVGARPSLSVFGSSSSFHDSSRPLAIEDTSKKRKGRPRGSKNVKKNK